MERREGGVNAERVMVETYERDSKNCNARILQGAVLSGGLTGQSFPDNNIFQTLDGGKKSQKDAHLPSGEPSRKGIQH